MKLHIHFRDTDTLRHYWPGGRVTVVLELTPADRENIASMAPTASLLAVADEEVPKGELDALLERIVSRSEPATRNAER